MSTATLPKGRHRVTVSDFVKINLASIVDWDRKPGILIVWLANEEGHEVRDDHPSYAVIVEWLKARGMMEDAA